MAHRINSKYSREWKANMISKIKAGQPIKFQTKFKPTYDWLRLQLLDHHRRFEVIVQGGVFHISTETNICPLCLDQRFH